MGSTTCDWKAPLPREGTPRKHGQDRRWSATRCKVCRCVTPEPVSRLGFLNFCACCQVGIAVGHVAPYSMENN